MPNLFYDFICRGENYATLNKLRLNKLRLKFQDTVEIAKRYTNDQSGFQILSDVLRKYACMFQFVLVIYFHAIFLESIRHR